MRQSVSGMRLALAELGGSAEALPRLIEDFRQATGLIVNYQPADPALLDGLSPAQAITLYRAAQEGLTNVQKHARASRIDVALAQHGGALCLRIGDTVPYSRAPSGCRASG